MPIESITNGGGENDFPDHLLCPICFNIPLEEVYQCVDGHVMCKKCYQKLDECPQCRRPLNKLQPIRCRHLEGILDGVRLDCSFKSNGCEVNQPKGVLRNHQSICCFDFKRFGEFVNICEFLSYLNCEGFRLNNGNGKCAVEHFIEEHNCILTKSEKFQMELTDFLKGPTWTPIIVELKDKKCWLLITAFYIKLDESIGWLSLFLPFVNNENFSRVPVQVEYTIMCNVEASNSTLNYSFIQDPIPLNKVEQVLPPENLPNRFQIQSLSPCLTKQGSLQVTCQVNPKSTKKEENRTKLEKFDCSSNSSESRPSRSTIAQPKHKARARTPKRTNRKWELFESPVLISGVALLVMLGMAYLVSFIWHKSVTSSSSSEGQPKQNAEMLQTLNDLLEGKENEEKEVEIPFGTRIKTPAGDLVAFRHHDPDEGEMDEDSNAMLLNAFMSDPAVSLKVKELLENGQKEKETEHVTEEKILVRRDEFEQMMTSGSIPNMDPHTASMIQGQLFESNGQGGQRINKKAVFQVAENGGVSVFKYLTESGQMDVDMIDEEENGETLLHRVLRSEMNKSKSLEKIKFLVENGANVKAVTWSAQNVLHYAAVFSNSADHVKYIFEQERPDPNELDEEGNTPLYYLVHNRNEEDALNIAEELLKNGADCRVKNGDGTTSQENSILLKEAKWTRGFIQLCQKYQVSN